MAYEREYKILGDKVTQYFDDNGKLIESHVERSKILDGTYSHTEVFDANDKKTGSYKKED